MNLLTRFSKTISSLLPFSLSTKQAELLAHLDTQKIYVENVRGLLDISHAEAMRILETAVRQGVFERKIEVACPDGTVAAFADTEDKLPSVVPCLVEDEDGRPEEKEIPTQSLRKTVYYQLNEHSAEPYARTA